MEAPAGAAESFPAEHHGHDGRRECFGGFELPAEIIVVDAAGDAGLFIVVDFGGDLPVAAPVDGAGPDVARGFRCFACFAHSKPGARIMAGYAPPRVDDRPMFGQDVYKRQLPMCRMYRYR